MKKMKKTKQTLTKFLLICFLTLSIFKVNAQEPTVTKTIGYPIGANISCYGIAYGATKYAAITSSGEVYTSADGDNWSKSTSLGESLYQITFANSMFVVCGANGYIATSTDAVTWTQRTTGSTSTLTDVQYLQNVFYAVGQNSTILSSSNGITWTAVSVNVGTSTDWFNQITYGGGKYIIMANSSTGQGPMTYQSTTGASNSWSAIGGFGVFGNTNLNKIVYLNSQFIVLTSSSDIFTSSNGTSWSNIRNSMTVTNPDNTTAAVGYSNYFNDVYYKEGTYYWVGFSNYNGGAYGAIFTSTNLTALTLQANPVNIVANKSYYLNGKHYIAGNEGFATSSNGTAYAFPYGSYNSLAYNGSTYVGVGAISALSGGVFTSSTFDSNTWTNKTPVGQRPLYGVVHDGNKFVAVGDKTVISSTDGNTWTSIATPSELYTCLAYGDSKYVVGGYASDYSAYFLKYSSDGITWTTANSDNFSYFKVRQVNGVFFALGLNNDYPASSGIIMSSSNGITWTNVTPTGLAFNVYTFNDVTWDGTKYHFIGADDAYNFFTISTATPSTTSSYANKGTINNVPDSVYLGSSWGEGFISYNNGKYVGAVVDTSNNKAYLIYSTNGTSWTSIATNDKSIVYDAIKDGNAFRIVGTGDEKISLLFVAPNTAPIFSNATTTLSVCQSAAATSINSLLQITDTDASQTETFSVTSAPSHGSITTGTTVGSGTNVSPTGWIYTPTNGYSGSDTFTIQVSDGTATASKTISVTVSLTPAPTASAQTFCAGATVANLVASPGVARLAPPALYKWYTASTGGSPLSTSTALVTGTYYVSYTQFSCESLRTLVAVTVNTTPAPTASAQTLCSGTTVANLAATGTSLKWYTANTGGSALATSTALSSGTYYVSQTLNSCESTRTSVSVTVNTTPLAPTASAQTFCAGATVADLVASPGSVGRYVPIAAYRWYTSNLGGSPLATSSTLVSGMYYVSQFVNSCEGERTSVAVTVNTTPAPTASAQTFCSGATVADLVATSGVARMTPSASYKWYTANTGGSDLATSTALSSGTYYVSQTLNDCESDRTSVSVTVTPSTSNTTTQTACTSYTWSVNGTTYTTSGTYTSVTGCATEILDLTIITPPTNFTSGNINYVVTSPTTVEVGINTDASGEIVIPASVTTDCGTYSVTSIEQSAFQNCSGLTSVSIPNSVTNIGDFAFYLSSLTSISIPNSITNIGQGTFASCINLTSVTIPNSVTSIGFGAFYLCTNLTSVTIPNSVTSIGYGAFYYCNNLTSVTIPESVASIEDLAFGGCTSLSSVICNVTSPITINASVFGGVNQAACTLTVPAGSVVAYQAAAVWQDFYFSNNNLSKVIDSQCGTTLPAINTLIRANAITGASHYKFKVVYGTTTQIIEPASGRWFRLTSLPGGTFYNTAYTISVAVKKNNVWGAYGTECTVTTPAFPATKVQNSQCGSVLPSLDTIISANAVSRASGYRFKVVKDTTVQIIEPISGRWLRLSSLAGGAFYDTTYTISVATKYNGVWSDYGVECDVVVISTTTEIQNSQCGSTLSELNSLISANAVAHASAYKFKVVNGATTETYETDTARWFRLTSLPSGALYNTTYTISVATKYNDVWGDYGTECTVTTPAFPLTKVQDSQCGATLASITTFISADAVNAASGYRFKVVNGASTEIIEAVSGSRWFRLTSLPGGASYTTTYTISAASRYNGVWSDYGSECTVTTPAAALTKLTDRQCGMTLASGNATLLYATSVSVAQKYRFEVSLGADAYTYDTASSSERSFRMTNVPGLTLVSGTTYGVRVAIMVNNAWQPYGESCSITTFGDAPNFVKSMNVDATNFNVTTYPNPFTENFNLNLTSLSEEKVTVIVYDMTGKLLERKEVVPSELSALQVGTNFASGVYNVIVSQGVYTKSIRVIKK
jgi:hypothetical protein